MKDTINQINISSDNLLHNFDYFQSLSQFVFPVVKSNAYGHGIREVSKILEAREFPYLVFDKYYEYENNKEFIKQNVLIMGYIDFEDLTQIDFDKVTLVVQSREIIQKLNSLKQKVRIHLEINTGMNRWGIQPEELNEYLELITASPNLELEGVMSHLADSDSYPDNYTVEQTVIFDQCIEVVLKFGLRPKYIHLAQTAGAYKKISRYCNSIRPGIGMHGINNLLESDIAYTKSKKLCPALSLTTKIIKIIRVKKGEKIGYNCTFEALQDLNLAIIPIGYYEGVNRGLSNVGQVDIEGKFYQFAGKICMNISMINLGDDIYKIGTAVKVVSDFANNPNSIANIAKLTNILSYNLLTNLNQNLSRIIK
jgi:alanine racemase